MVSAAKRKLKGKTGPSAATPAPVAQRLWTSIDPPLSPWLLDAIASQGFEKMTPVQASTIPLFLGNKDVVVEAVTGSGKTMAFLVPVIERILRSQEVSKKGHVSAVIVSPTRELASQIFNVLQTLLAFHDASKSDEPEDKLRPRVKPLLLLGGTTSPAQDLKNFLEQAPNLLIGTPGRLYELLSSNHVHCHNETFEALVLDEADRLLDLGFKDTLSKIISRLPKQRRTGLFSATVTDALVGSLIRAGLRNPVKVVVKVRGDEPSATTGSTHLVEKRTPASLKLAYILASPTQRLHLIRPLLNLETPQKTIIYFSNCATVDYYAPLFPHILQDRVGKYAIIPLHGKLPSNVRAKNFKKFIETATPCIMLTTDLAARGLDVAEVDLVIQIDPPQDPKAFLHRCGRAGRAGRKGTAITFLSPGCEEDYVPFLSVRKTPVHLYTGLPEEVTDPVKMEEGTKDMVARLREQVLKDRALHEKGVKAFVSHVRAYSKHQTPSIFKVEECDWRDLVEAFALVRVPRMPELKNTEIKLEVTVDMQTYAFKDKLREAQRQKELANPALVAPKYKSKEEVEAQKKKNTAWSVKSDTLETKQERRERKKKKREAEKLSKMTPEEKAKEEEWRELVEIVRKQKAEMEQGEDGDGDVFMGLD